MMKLRFGKRLVTVATWHRRTNFPGRRQLVAPEFPLCEFWSRYE